MRSILIFSFMLAGILAGGESYGQSKIPIIPEKTGVVLVCISSSLDSAIGAAFYTIRPDGDPTYSHTNIDQTVLAGDSTISRILGLTSTLHGLQLKPFIPTHSVAFEDIRERSNPQLFARGDVIQSIDPSGNLSALRASEGKLAHWFLLFYSDPIPGGRAAVLAKRSQLIQLAEPMFIRQPLYTPNDSLVNQQYALSLMHCFEAWDLVRCDSTMVIADADIGTDWTHLDLSNSIYQNPGEIGIDKNGRDKRYNGIDDDSNGFIDDWHGWDFGGTYGTTPDNDARPGDGINHGTQTAGIFAAQGNNVLGMAGIAFGARIIPIKISDDAGANLDFGFEGITYAADMHARIVNCSWGGTGRSDAEQDAINYAYAKNCAVVAAAGNSGENFPFEDLYPAAYDHVLSVAAVDGNGNNADFSDFNTHVDISAPGVDVTSSITGNSYITSGADGTSFASPNAAGVVALVLQQFPNLTAGQAMEQVRVTGNPVLGLDSDRVHFEGHGVADAFRAVSDTNTYSARVDSITVKDHNGIGSFAPGESGGIIIHAMNYLKPLGHLMARVEVVNGANYVALQQTSIPLGAVATLGEVSNDPAAFQIAVADSAPQNTEVLIRVFFYDSVAGYAEDYDYIHFVIEPSYLDLNANDLTVTFSSIGSLGYNDVLNNEEGSGFLWRNAPDSISPFERTLLYEGGLMVGTDTNHVVDVVLGADGETADEDLKPSGLIHYVQPPDHVNAAQELAFALTDSLADSSIQIGLHATCQAYAFTQGLAANAVVAKYMFRGTPGSLFAMSDSAAATLFLDWDIGLSGGNNITLFDSASETAITYRLDPGYPYLGMKLLSKLPAGASLNYHAIMNNGSQGDLDVYGPFSKSNKWTSMNEFYSSAGPGDISHTFGLKNMPVHSQDSVEMTVVIAVAGNEALLHQTIAETEALWDQPLGVTSTSGPAMNVLETFPNPFHNMLHISWNLSGSARITIYDALGRIILSRDLNGSQFDFTPSGIPSGFYTIDVSVGGTHLRRQVVASE
jgi:subtilisin family serine protease